MVAADQQNNNHQQENQSPSRRANNDQQIFVERQPANKSGCFWEEKSRNENQKKKTVKESPVKVHIWITKRDRRQKKGNLKKTQT